MASPNEILAVVLPLLVGLALIGLAALVLRRGGGHAHSRLFGALFLFSGSKSIGDGLTASYARDDGSNGYVADALNASSPLFPDALTWLYITQICALAMLPILFLFCATFPQPRPWIRARPWLGVLAFVPSILVATVVYGVPESPVVLPAVLAFNVVATILTATALAWVLVTRKRSKDHIERQQATYVAIGFLPSFVATWSLTAVFFALEGELLSGETVGGLVSFILRFASPLFEVVAAGLVAFAILKYNILGVNPQFRVGVKSAVVGFVFVLVFLVTQAIENIILQGKLFTFAGEYGSFLLSGVTSVVLFKPIEKVSSGVSNRLLPKAQGLDETMTRAAEVYHAQCTYVLRDAQVSERELAFLRNLRTQLGITDAQARTIEQNVERLLKVDAPETGTSGKPQPATPSEPVAARAARPAPAARPKATPPAKPAPPSTARAKPSAAKATGKQTPARPKKAPTSAKTRGKSK